MQFLGVILDSVQKINLKLFIVYFVSRSFFLKVLIITYWLQWKQNIKIYSEDLTRESVAWNVFSKF